MSAPDGPLFDPVVVSTSALQHAARSAGTLPPLERVRDDVWAIGVPMPGGQRGLAYTLSYVLRDSRKRLHIVDPGWDSPENREHVGEALHVIDPAGALASVIVTHLHPDHLGLAAHLRASMGAPIVMHALDAAAVARPAVFEPNDLARWGVPPDVERQFGAAARSAPPTPAIEVDVLLSGSESPVEVDGHVIRAIHTPGHTAGSICLALPELGAVITGDHVLPEIHPGLGLGGTTGRNPIGDYLNSLDRIRGVGDMEVLPGHEYRFRGLAGRCSALGGRHRTRTREVAQVLASDPDSTVWQIASRLTWSAGWEGLHGFFLYSALSQTALHADLVRAGEAGAPPA